MYKHKAKVGYWYDELLRNKKNSKTVKFYAPEN